VTTSKAVECSISLLECIGLPIVYKPSRTAPQSALENLGVAELREANSLNCPNGPASAVTDDNESTLSATCNFFLTCTIRFG
jgi:hypothetical protein